jgi:hypothetical protein
VVTFLGLLLRVEICKKIIGSHYPPGGWGEGIKQSISSFFQNFLIYFFYFLWPIFIYLFLGGGRLGILREQTQERGTPLACASIDLLLRETKVKPSYNLEWSLDLIFWKFQEKHIIRIHAGHFYLLIIDPTFYSVSTFEI